MFGTHRDSASTKSIFYRLLGRARACDVLLSIKLGTTNERVTGLCDTGFRVRLLGQMVPKLLDSIIPAQMAYTRFSAVAYSESQISRVSIQAGKKLSGATTLSSKLPT